MTTSTIQWAKLKFDPTAAQPSKQNPDWKPQHSVLVTLNDAASTEARIYFPQGEFSGLRKDDTIMCEYRDGKWRLAKTQTPELMQLLQQRQPIGTAPTAPTPVAAPATAPQSQGNQAPADAEKAWEQLLGRAAKRYSRAVDAALWIVEQKFGVNKGTVAGNVETQAVVKEIATSLFIEANRNCR